jgi:hypothetical protein
MSRPCKICTSEFVNQIDAALALGHGPHSISRAHPDWPSAYAIERHRRAGHHLKVLTPSKKSNAEKHLTICAEDAFQDYQDLKAQKSSRKERQEARKEVRELYTSVGQFTGELKNANERIEEAVKKGKQQADANVGIPLSALDTIMRTADIRQLKVIPRDDA